MSGFEDGLVALSKAFEVTQRQLNAALSREHRLKALLDSMTPIAAGPISPGGPSLSTSQRVTERKIDSKVDADPADDFRRRVEGFAQRRRGCKVHAAHTANETGVDEGNGWTLVKWLAPVASQVLGSLLLDILSTGFKSEVDQLALAEAIGDLPTPSLLETFLAKGDVVGALAKAIHGKAVELRTAAAPTGHELSSKFASQSGTFEMSYGNQSAFSMGLERLVGPADVCVEDAMRREHCSAEDSFLQWTTSNYGITTASVVEWHFVVQPEAGIKPILDAAAQRYASLDIHSFPVETKNAHHPRQAIPLAQFSEQLSEINRSLESRGEKKVTQEELIGARLYTGPMFEKYNSVNRGGALDLEQPALMVATWQRLCLSNRYSTSVHVINSALIKLSKRSKVLTLYRGISGGILPKAFWKKDEMGARGGTEFGFMSTTTDRAVALQYAAQAGAGTILELQAGAIDRGADLSWLSQYPHEAEICFPPLTHLEVMDTRVDGCVLVVEVRPNVNFGALTIEEVTSKRKKLVMDMSRHLQEEVREVFLCPHRKVFSAENELEAFGELIFERALEKLEEACNGEAKHYNCNDFLLRRMTEALQVKKDIENCMHFGRSIAAKQHWSAMDLEILQRVPQVVEAINTLACQASDRHLMRRLARDGSQIEVVRSTLRHIPCLTPTGEASRVYLGMKKIADIWLDVGPLSERLHSKDDSLRSSALRLLKQKVTPLSADIKGILFRMTETILRPNLLEKATLPVRRAAIELFGAFGPVAKGYTAIMKRYIGFHEVKSVHDVLTETERQILSEDGVTDDTEKARQFFGPIDKKERMGICVITLGAAGLDALANMHAIDCFADVTDCLDWTLRLRRDATLAEASEGLIDALATMRASTLNALGKLVRVLDADDVCPHSIGQEQLLKLPMLQTSDTRLGKATSEQAALGDVDLLHEDPAYFVGEIASFLKDPLPQVRQAAAHALGVFAHRAPQQQQQQQQQEQQEQEGQEGQQETAAASLAGALAHPSRLQGARRSTAAATASRFALALRASGQGKSGRGSGSRTDESDSKDKDKDNDKDKDKDRAEGSVNGFGRGQSLEEDDDDDDDDDSDARSLPRDVLKRLRMVWAVEVNKHIPAIVEVAVKDAHDLTRKAACEALSKLSLVDVPVAIQECERCFHGPKVYIKRAAEALAALDEESVRQAPPLPAMAGAVARLVFSLRVRSQLQPEETGAGDHGGSGAKAGATSDTDSENDSNDTDDDGDDEVEVDAGATSEPVPTSTTSSAANASSPGKLHPARICARPSNHKKKQTHFEAAADILRIFEGADREAVRRGLLVLFSFVEAPTEGSHGARVAAACALRDLGDKVEHHATELAQVSLVDRDLEVTAFLREALSNFSEPVRREAMESLLAGRSSAEDFANRELANTLLALGGDLAGKVSPLAEAAAAAAECVALGMATIPTLPEDHFLEGPQPQLRLTNSYKEAQARLTSFSGEAMKVILLVLPNYLQDHRSGRYKMKIVAIRNLLRLVLPEAHGWCANQIAVSMSDCAPPVRFEAVKAMEGFGHAASPHARSIAFVARTDREGTVRAAALQALKAMECPAVTSPGSQA